MATMTTTRKNKEDVIVNEEHAEEEEAKEDDGEENWERGQNINNVNDTEKKHDMKHNFKRY